MFCWSQTNIIKKVQASSSKIFFLYFNKIHENLSSKHCSLGSKNVFKEDEQDSSASFKGQQQT
jgi:hypothetical protein